MQNISDFITALSNRLMVAYVSSIDFDGFPNTKAMLLTPHHTEGRIFYFSTKTASLRVNQFKKNPQACLYLCDETNYIGIQLRGHMEVLTDRDSRALLWTDGDEQYYPKGMDDPDYCVLRFTAIDGRLYNEGEQKIFSFENKFT